MIAVRITDLVMGKISFKDKMPIQIFHESGFEYSVIVTNFSEKVWKLSSVKAIYLSFVIR